MYTSPLGNLGQGIDDALMHKVAEAKVKQLAAAIAVRVEIAVAPDNQGWSQVNRDIRPCARSLTSATVLV